MTDLIFCHKIRVTRVLNRYTFKQKGGDDNMHGYYPPWWTYVPSTIISVVSITISLVLLLK